ncbi:MAG: hypothetical protein J2P36_32425, partial [Ktedonobacteraceae bacterium]|nr:hypothetical protein [Ktedonobacteraceae bacterium]
MAIMIFAAAASNAVYGLLCLVGFLIFVALFLAGSLYLRKRRRRTALGQVQMQDTAETSEELDRLREEDEEEEEGEGGQG